VPPESAAETIETNGCSIVLRRVAGPEASELFLHCRPPPGTAGAGEQASAVYAAILGLLEGEGGSFDSVVSEMLFLRSVQDDLEPIRAARRGALGACSEPSHRPATTEIEQPPLSSQARLEVSLHAIVPDGAPLRVESLDASSPCDCPECASLHALRVDLGDEVRLQAGALYGRGEGAYEQTHAMFSVAEALLKQAGLGFRDVVRTWIHLREMDRDYADFNRARREFFEERGIDPAPASTGIGGGPAPEGHDLCLGFLAVQGRGPTESQMMTTPTLNEAPAYGSDFARGMRVEEVNKIALHVSGTASIDEAGRSVHREDFDAQVDRTLVNIASLLEGQGAGLGDVVSAITYLKRPEDADRLREKLDAAGFRGFPNALVLAPVCRPELLCEVEALAVLPRPAGRG
jgi:enamine deaminase RidA (YjgF/YER057c/UK114 family)